MYAPAKLSGLLIHGSITPAGDNQVGLSIPSNTIPLVEVAPKLAPAFSAIAELALVTFRKFGIPVAAVSKSKGAGVPVNKEFVTSKVSLSLAVSRSVTSRVFATIL